MPENPIELAYKAHAYVHSEAYRRGERKKSRDPRREAPALVQAMTHLGREGMSLARARRQARQAVAEPEANQYMEGLDWDGLLDFLETLEVFLKAGPRGRKEKGMREFTKREDKRLSAKEVSEQARKLASEKIRGEVVKNKLKKMGAHVTAARDKWEALAALARFYPRSGIPKGYVNSLVEQLETTDLGAFKQIVAQSLIFYEADAIRKRR